MAVVALADQRARGGRLPDRALDFSIVGIEDPHRARGDDRPVALFEIGDAPRQRRQRQGVRAQKHLVVAVADCERAAAAGADQQIVLAGEQKGEGEGAFESRQGLRHRIPRRKPLGEKMRRQDCHRLGVGLGSEGVAKCGKFLPQRLEILDNAVMDDGDPVSCDRVRVGLGRQAMRRPTSVPDADHPLHRLAVEPPGEVDELAFRLPAFDASLDQGPDAGRIIPAIFEAP